MMARLVDQRLRRCGDRRARAEMARRYLPLARALALRYRHTHEPVDDLVQTACLGLIKAIDRWDPDRGTAFASFAVPTILGELRRHFRDSTWMVKPPRATQELALKIARTREQLWASLGHEPTTDEIATALGRSCDDVVEAMAAAEGQNLLSLDAPVGEADEGATHLDLVGGSDDALGAVEEKVFAHDLVSVLDRRSRDVLRMRFELDLLQREIGELIGVSQIHVSRILRDALDTLHHHATGISPAAPRAAAA
jgi:RNA polymerase sigma-B factor